MAVNLKKGEKISLKKTSDRELNHVFMGLGWDVKDGGFLGSLFGKDKEIDLDASCLMLDDELTVKELVFYNNLKCKNASVWHSGDNRTGEGDGDDEVLNVRLKDVPSDIKYLVFTVTSYEEQTFNEIDNAFCRLVDDNNKELVHFKISGGGANTAMLMAVLYQHNGEWRFKAMGMPMQGKTPFDVVEACQEALANEINSGLLND